MIPKIIHYTWFSGEEFPPQIKKCIESWHKCMPEYDFICWDSDRIKEIDSVWLSETLKEKNGHLQLILSVYMLFIIMEEFILIQTVCCISH